MPIYRIVGVRPWDSGDAHADDDQFIEADSEAEARERFIPTGTASEIYSVALTPFKTIDDNKYYLVAFGQESLPATRRLKTFLLVKARNGQEAMKKAMEIGNTWSGTVTYPHEIYYFGEIPPYAEAVKSRR
jgi:hypothetical protein